MIFCVVLHKFSASFVDFFLVNAVILVTAVFQCYNTTDILPAAFQSTYKKNTLQDGKNGSIFSPKKVLTQCHEEVKYK